MTTSNCGPAGRLTSTVRTLVRSGAYVALFIGGGAAGFAIWGIPPEVGSALADHTATRRLVDGGEPVASIVTTRADGESLCSGVPLKDTDWVATAAHCVDDDPTQILVKFGGITYAASGYVAHPGYDQDAEADPRFDVAFILTVPATGTRIGEACTVSLGDVPNDTDLVALGYQDLDVFGLSVAPQQQYAAGGRYPKRCDIPTGDAVGRLDETPYYVACDFHSGGSGGPVLAETADGYILAGVTSTGDELGYNGIPAAAMFAEALAQPIVPLAVPAWANSEPPATGAGWGEGMWSSTNTG